MIPFASSGFLDDMFFREDEQFHNSVARSENAQATDVPDVVRTPRISDIVDDDEGDESAEPPDHGPNVWRNPDISTSSDVAAPTADEKNADRNSPVDDDSLGANDYGAFDSTPDGRNRSAVMRLYDFERFVDYKVDHYRSQGKDPLDLFDPSKPDYLGAPRVLAPFVGDGLLWLASNNGDDASGRPPKLPTADAASGDTTPGNGAANFGPIGNSDAAETAPDEPAAAEDAREKAAARLARMMRGGGYPDTNLLPLTLLLALPFAPEIAPAILEADGIGATLSAGVVSALRMVWPKIKDVVTQLPQFLRAGHNPMGLGFEDFLKEIQTHLTQPPETENEPSSQNGDGDGPSTTYDEIQNLRHTDARDLLRLLDPDNPVLKEADGLTRAPTAEDVERVHKEIEGQKESAVNTIGTGLEKHHNAPRGQRESFERAGLDIEKYTTYIRKNDHRLKPGGLHTGQNHWNRQWNDFFRQNRNADAAKINEQLLKMMKDLPRWTR